jgi:hypothetical protein
MSANRTSLSRVLGVLLVLGMVQGCDCAGGHDESEHPEGHEGTGDHPEGEPEGEGEPTAAATEVGPLGWTAVVESETGEDEYVEHHLLMWRTGPATGERAELAELGHFSNWAGDYTLYVQSEEATEESHPRPLTLLGVRGACAATASRLLHLRVTFDPHHGDAEERLYDALEFEDCAGPYAFGASGTFEMTELSTRTMETPPEEVMAVVRESEDAITEESGDEPMRVVGREIPELHVWVISGWETYVVRGTTIVTHTEDSAIGAVTLGGRTMLLMRGDEGPELRTPGEDRLESVNPDADPNAHEETTEAPAEHP